MTASRHPRGAAPATFQRELKKKLHRLEEALTEPANVTRHQEALHRFRVSMKEWRAALHLLQFVDESFPYQELHDRFRPVFAAAGELRFWQLQRGFLNRSPLPAQGFEQQYRAYLRQRLRKARKDFLDAVANADWPRWRKLKPVVEDACTRCSAAVLRAYFDALSGQMAARKAELSRRRPKELHELRQWLREYADNRKLTAKRLAFDPGPPRGLSRDSAALQALLGIWHDQDEACRQLAADLRAADSTADVIAQGQRLLRDWKKTERAMWDQVIADLASV